VINHACKGKQSRHVKKREEKYEKIVPGSIALSWAFILLFTLTLHHDFVLGFVNDDLLSRY